MTRKAGRILVISGALVAVVAGGVSIAVAARQGSDASFADSAGATSTQPTTQPSPSGSALPSTPAETTTVAAPTTAATSIAATSTALSATASSSTVPSSAGSSASPLPGRTVEVTLGFLDWDAAGRRVEAAGFAAGVVESGGVCTLTLTESGASVRVTNTAQADATTTNCGGFKVPASRLIPGEWRATLSYRSATAHGTSAPAMVTVPAS